jgi:hypothetical protein
VSVSDWETFFSGLQTELLGLYKDAKMRSASDFQTAWQEIATGLKEVK